MNTIGESDHGSPGRASTRPAMTVGDVLISVRNASSCPNVVFATQQPQVIVMLQWALLFLVLGLLAALFGFTGIAGASIGIAKILFFVFLVVFVVMLLMGLTRGRGSFR